MHRENGDEPPCKRCRKPAGLHKQSAKAWEVWLTLDRHGRNLDTMGGAPLPLRLEAVHQECARCMDPHTTHRLVMLLEDTVYKKRLEAFAEKQKNNASK